MARGADSVRALRRANESMGERLELVYAMLRHSGALTDPTCITNERCVAHELEKAAEELRAEHSRMAGVAAPPPSEEGFRVKIKVASDLFVKEVRAIARDCEVAADSALAAKDPGTHMAFADTMVNRIHALRKLAAANGYEA